MEKTILPEISNWIKTKDAIHHVFNIHMKYIVDKFIKNHDDYKVQIISEHSILVTKCQKT